MNEKIIQMAKRYGVISVPGAFTPTETLHAFEQGADVVKVFPAGIAGRGDLAADVYQERLLRGPSRQDVSLRQPR